MKGTVGEKAEETMTWYQSITSKVNYAGGSRGRHQGSRHLATRKYHHVQHLATQKEKLSQTSLILISIRKFTRQLEQSKQRLLILLHIDGLMICKFLTLIFSFWYLFSNSNYTQTPFYPRIKVQKSIRNLENSLIYTFRPNVLVKRSAKHRRFQKRNS